MRSTKIVPTINSSSKVTFARKSTLATSNLLEVCETHSRAAKTKEGSTDEGSLRSRRSSTRGSRSKLKKLSKAFKNLLEGDDDIKPELQEKIDYFYAPYEKQDKGGMPITFNFEESTDDYLNNSKNHVHFSEISKQNWKEVSKQVLTSKGDDFRKLLKAVNGKLFCDLRKIANNKVDKPPRRDPSIGISLFKKALACKLSNSAKEDTDYTTNDNLSKLKPRRSIRTPLLALSRPSRHSQPKHSSMERTTSSQYGLKNSDKILRTLIPLKEAFDPDNIQITYRRLRRRGSVDYPCSSKALSKPSSRCSQKPQGFRRHQNSECADTSVELPFDRLRTSSCPLVKHKNRKVKLFRDINLAKRQAKPNAEFTVIKDRIRKLSECGYPNPNTR